MNPEVTQLRAALVQAIRAMVEAKELLDDRWRAPFEARQRAKLFLEAGITAANQVLEAGAVP